MWHAIKVRTQRLARDEGGAVTIDWVVLTAALVGIGVITTLSVTSLAAGPAERIGDALSSIDVTHWPTP